MNFLESRKRIYDRFPKDKTLTNFLLMYNVCEEDFVSLQDRIGEDDTLIMPHDGERLHPLLALIRPKPVLEQIRGDRRPLHIQFSEMSHSLLLEDPKTLTNVNSLEDLK